MPKSPVTSPWNDAGMNKELTAAIAAVIYLSGISVLHVHASDGGSWAVVPVMVSCGRWAVAGGLCEPACPAYSQRLSALAKESSDEPRNAQRADCSNCNCHLSIRDFSAPSSMQLMQPSLVCGKDATMQVCAWLKDAWHSP